MASLLEKKTFRFAILREVAAIVLILLASYFAIGALRAHISSVGDTIVAENALFAQREFDKSTYDRLHGELPKIRDLAERIAAAFPQTEDMRSFLAVLDTFAAKHSVTAMVSVGGATASGILRDGAALRTVAVDIELTGAHDAVRSYISDIEHLSYFFTLNEVIEHRDPAHDGFVDDMLHGTVWTEPKQALTREQQP